MLDGFLENDSLSGARALLDDLGLTPVCAASALPDLWIPGPEREASPEKMADAMRSVLKSWPE